MKLISLAYLAEHDEGWNKVFTAPTSLEDEQRRANRKHVHAQVQRLGIRRSCLQFGSQETFQPSEEWDSGKKDPLGSSRTKSSWVLEWMVVCLWRLHQQLLRTKCPMNKLVSLMYPGSGVCGRWSKRFTQGEAGIQGCTQSPINQYL